MLTKSIKTIVAAGVATTILASGAHADSCIAELEEFGFPATCTEVNNEVLVRLDNEKFFDEIMWQSGGGDGGDGGAGGGDGGSGAAD